MRQTLGPVSPATLHGAVTSLRSHTSPEGAALRPGQGEVSITGVPRRAEGLQVPHHTGGMPNPHLLGMQVQPVFTWMPLKVPSGASVPFFLTPLQSLHRGGASV